MPRTVTVTIPACLAPLAAGPRAGQPATGSATGYRRHLNAGEPACYACTAANTEAARTWQARNRKPAQPKPPVLCSVKDCTLPAISRGRCPGHHARVTRGTAGGRDWRFGMPRDYVEPLAVRLSRYITLAPTGCWPWTGALDDRGYARASLMLPDGRRVVRSVHRLTYEMAVGPIPEGLELDHTCHGDAVLRGECDGGLTCTHRRCVNPAHLEPVTTRENARRGVRAVRARNRNRRTT